MSELTLEQWKAKFKNANMDKSEAIFNERKAQSDLARYKEMCEKLAGVTQLALNAFEKNWCIDWDDLTKTLAEYEKLKGEK